MADAIPAEALVLVADGAKATLFRNHGKGGTVELKALRHLTPEALAADGPSGSQPEDQSPKDTNEAAFASQMAHLLQTMKARNDYDSLVLIAAPHTLGKLRAALHKTVEQSVVKTLSKDLTNHPVADVEKALAA